MTVATLITLVVCFLPTYVPQLNLLRYAGKSWTVSEQTTFANALVDSKKIVRFKDIKFTGGTVAISFNTQGAAKEISFAYQVKPVSLKNGDLLIQLLDSDNDVRFSLLCRMTKTDAVFAMNLLPDTPPTGFDISKDKVILLKCMATK